MSILGAGSVVGQLAILGTNAAVSSGPHRKIEQAARSHSIVIEKIVADAFNAEIQRRGNFAPASPGTGDATFKLTVKYGLELPIKDSFHGSLAPAVLVRPELMKEGKRIYDLSRRYAGGLANKKHWRRFDDFMSNPELLRIGWQPAAADAAKWVMNDLMRKSGLDQKAAAEKPMVAVTEKPRSR